MTTTQWIALASVAAVGVSALAIVAALKGVRDQLRVTVFLTYTDRYAKVMSQVPFEAREPGSNYRLASRPEDERIRVLGAFREYFNLCSEEIWLHELSTDRPRHLECLEERNAASCAIPEFPGGVGGAGT